MAGVGLGACFPVPEVPLPGLVVAGGIIIELNVKRLPALSGLGMEISLRRLIDGDVVFLRHRVSSRLPADDSGYGQRHGIVGSFLACLAGISMGGILFRTFGAIPEIPEPTGDAANRHRGIGELHCQRLRAAPRVSGEVCLKPHQDVVGLGKLIRPGVPIDRATNLKRHGIYARFGVDIGGVGHGAVHHPITIEVPLPGGMVATGVVVEMNCEGLQALGDIGMEIRHRGYIYLYIILFGLRLAAQRSGHGERDGVSDVLRSGAADLLLRTEGNARLRRGVSPYPDILVINIRRLTTVSIVAEHKPVEIASKVIQHQSVALPVPSTTVTIMIVPPPVLGPIYPVKPGARK